MTQEEKAKRYDEALERAKKLQKTCDSMAVVGWCEYIFPELKESADEKMRKSIIYALRNGGFYSQDKTDEAIAWIEKVKVVKPVKPIFKTGDEVYNRFDKSLGHVVIESVDDTTYYGDTTNFDITDQDQWGIVRSCENCQCGHYICKSKKYNHPAVSCYLHEDCGGDEPIIIPDDDFVETAMTCKEFEQEN